MHKPFLTLFLSCLTILWNLNLRAQVGPFDPAQWPPTSDPNKVVHYTTLDPDLQPLGAGWLGGALSVLSGGDQATVPISIGCLPGTKVLGNYLNTADPGFSEWADNDTIDILMQVYGDSGVLAPNGTPRGFHFLTGVLPELAAPLGGVLPVETRNGKWNWVLFRIANGVRPSDGTRFVGSIPANAGGAFLSGGVNGGTLRLEGVPNLILRTIAFGELGAFGEPNQINAFLPADQCDPEPETNHAFLDIHSGLSRNLSVLTGGDQPTESVTDVGPEDDRRGAARDRGPVRRLRPDRPRAWLSRRALAERICQPR